MQLAKEIAKIAAITMVVMILSAQSATVRKLTGQNAPQ